MRTSLVTSYNYSLDQQFYTPLNHRHLRSCLSRNRGLVSKDIACRSMPIPEQENIFLYSIFAADFHLRKDIQSEVLISATRFK